MEKLTIGFEIKKASRFEEAFSLLSKKYLVA